MSTCHSALRCAKVQVRFESNDIDVYIVVVLRIRFVGGMVWPDQCIVVEGERRDFQNTNKQTKTLIQALPAQLSHSQIVFTNSSGE